MAPRTHTPDDPAARDALAAREVARRAEEAAKKGDADTEPDDPAEAGGSEAPPPVPYDPDDAREDLHSVALLLFRIPAILNPPADVKRAEQEHEDRAGKVARRLSGRVARHFSGGWFAVAGAVADVLDLAALELLRRRADERAIAPKGAA